MLNFKNPKPQGERFLESWDKEEALCAQQFAFVGTDFFWHSPWGAGPDAEQRPRRSVEPEESAEMYRFL